MGLDAVVYRHINNLEIDRADKEKALIDEERGEVYFEDPEMARKYGHRPFIAIEKRLGNIAAIGAIDQEIVSVIGGAPSTMHEKVLYSGSHCGDFIAYDELDQVDAEIAMIKKLSAGVRTPLLDGFLSDMTDLVKAAKEQKQPIVFT